MAKLDEMVQKLKFLFYVIVTSVFLNCLVIYFHPNWLAKITDSQQEKVCKHSKCGHVKKLKPTNYSNNFYNRRIKRYPEKEQIEFQISVCPKKIEMTISNIQLINDSRDGFHIFVFNEATGSFMAHFYDNANSTMGNWAKNVDHFLKSIQDGRIIIILHKNFQGQRKGTNFIELGKILQIYTSNLLSMKRGNFTVTSWILLAHKGVGKIAELYQWKNIKFPKECLKMSKSLGLSEEIAICPNWPDSERTRARRRLCRLVEGYRSLCSCNSLDTIPHFANRQNQTYIQIPIAVVSVNDPHYLLRVISSLTSVKGLHPKNILIFIDQNYEESKLIVDLFKLKLIRVRLQGNIDMPSKNSYKFRTAIANAFRHFYLAQYLIIMEDNVDSSGDLLYYFNQTIDIIGNQTKIFNVAASNNQYFCSETFQRETYLSEYMPDTTFMISRKLWQNELSLYWPDNSGDKSWKVWFQDFMIKSDRLCLYPLVSRVFYFGRQRESFKSVQIHKSDKTKFLNYDLNPLSTSSHDAFLKKISDKSLEWNLDKINCSNTDIFRNARDFKNESSNLILIKVSMSSREDSSKWNYLRKCLQLSLVQLQSCWYKMSCMLCFESTKVRNMLKEFQNNCKSQEKIIRILFLSTYKLMMNSQFV